MCADWNQSRADYRAMSVYFAGGNAKGGAPTTSTPGGNASGNGTASLASAAAAAAANLKPAASKFIQQSSSDIKSADAKMLEAQIASLGTMTRNARAAKKISRNKQTIQALQTTIKEKPKFVKMVEYSIECFKNLAVDEVSIEELIDEGVLDTLMNVLKLNPYNESLQQMVNKTLQAFCINDRIAKMIGDRLGTNNGIVFSLKKHVEPQTISSSLMAAHKLMRAPTNIDYLVSSGMIGAIGHVMKTCEEDLDVVTNGVQCLNRIMDEPKYAPQMMEANIVPELLAALTHFPESAALMEHGLALITKLAASSPSILAQLKEQGAVDILVKALELHPYNDQLLRLGATALKYLSALSDLSSAFGVKVGNNSETAAALGKLASLLLVDENVDYMVQNSGIQWLISALQGAVSDTSATSLQILASGCRALMRMANDEKKIYGIMQHGGVKLLLSIIEAHGKNEEVACSALACLAKMVTRKENAVYIVKSGGIAAAYNALTAHPKSEKVARQCLDFFQRVAAHEECVPMLVDAGVIPSIVGILQNHMNSPQILKSAITALGRMAISADNMKKIAEAGGMQALIAVLNAHKDNVDVAKPALLMIETCALLPANVEVLRANGAMDAILGAMELHSENADFTAIGQRALAMIAGEAQIKQAVEYLGQVAESIGKMTPSAAAQSIDKLCNAVKLVGNLAMVDANIKHLTGAGAVKRLVAAYEAAAKLAASEKRSAAMAAASAVCFVSASRRPPPSRSSAP